LATRDFDRVYREPARRLRSGHFLVLARRRKEGAARWGISVKARLGGAVLRNRIKRRLREILRGCALPPAWDVVIQPQSAAVAAADFAALRNELEELFRAALSEKA
jgi:ribonuclease P protein component